MGKNISFKRLFKNIDIFGLPISLNFDEKGVTHQSLMGGCCSLLYITIVIWFVVIYTMEILSGAMDTYSLQKYQYEPDDLGDV